MPSSFSATWDSPAKVNLCLRIVGKRPDGYHLLDSIFAAIDLRDRIDIEVRDVARGRPTRVTMRCAYPGVPSDATNLAARAADVLLRETGVGADVTIDIAKRIPPGAGLGGGSSNAATVLDGLHRGLRLAVSEARLREIALTLGADVPFFLTGGCARVRGIGERVDPIRGWPGFRLLVALPPVAVSTAAAFRAYTGRLALDGDAAGALASADRPLPELLLNDLEQTVLPAHPAVAHAKRTFLDAGAAAAVMSGSGSAVVAIAPDPDAVAAAFRARAPDVPLHAVRILPPRSAPNG